MAATHPASLFCDSLPFVTGMKLPPDFAREFVRVSVAGDNRQACAAVGKNFPFSKESADKFFITEASPELMALGASLAEANPLKAKAFREEVVRWAKHFRFNSVGF